MIRCRPRMRFNGPTIPSPSRRPRTIHKGRVLAPSMTAKLFATTNAASEPLVLERSGVREPWAIAGAGPSELACLNPGQYRVVHQGHSFKVLVLKQDPENGTVRLRIGAHCHTVKLDGERSLLVKLLGIDKAGGKALGELKAPMPGLVLKMLVKEGDAVKKNDPLLVLEAMKMENVIKSTGDAIVKKIHAKERAAVEKGQLLLSFE